MKIKLVTEHYNAFPDVIGCVFATKDQVWFGNQVDKSHADPCTHPKAWRTKFGRRVGCRLCGREIK